MSLELQIFENSEFGQIRTLTISGEPWFVGKDVAAALGYSDTDQALRKHIDGEDKLTRQIDGSGQNRIMTIINESGLYCLILSSKLPAAKKFKRWVTAEVLPSIRKTGAYSINSQPDRTLHIVETLASCVGELAKCVEKLTERMEAPEQAASVQNRIRFYEPVRKPLSTTAQALWHTLVQLEHDFQSFGQVQISNDQLTRLMNVRSKNTLRSARNELLDAGYIAFYPGVKGNPGTYQIITESGQASEN